MPIWILPIDFGTLDTFLYELLEGWSHIKFVTSKREKPTERLVIYKLCQPQLGDLGEIRLRYRGANQSELQSSSPPRPPIQFLTPEEKASIQDALPADLQGQERIMRYAVLLSDKEHEKREALYRPLEEHHEKVIEGIFNWLKHRGLLPPAQKVGVMPDKPGHPPDPDYDRAYQQILAGRPKEEVYQEWLKRAIDENKLPDNSRESFNKAMRSRRRKEGTG